MPLITDEPVLLRRAVFTCDRCGKQVIRELSEPEIPELPDGWILAAHPDEAPKELVFDRRACTSQWFRTWVRVRYGGSPELPRRRGRKTKPARPVHVDPDEGLLPEDHG